MIKRSIPLLAFLFSAFLIGAQTPQTVTRTNLKGDGVSSAQRSVACIDQDAGDVQPGAFNGDSNDTDFPQVFLCFGDELDIDHIAGTSDLTGDPDLATTAGIGYGFYNMPPTVDGPNLDAILLDPAIIDNPPFPPGVEPIYLAFGDVAGNATFTNDGAVQNFFNNGNPIEIYFAPVTVDDFANGIFEQANVNAPAGPCTRVSTDQAFAVVYLNELTITNQILTGTTGSFLGQGGLGEFDGSNYSSIVIENAMMPGVFGMVTNGNSGHDDIVEFSVPTEGTYNLSLIHI